MNLYEYQAKKIFAEAGVPVPNGRVADTPSEVKQIAEEIGGTVVIKAQVPIGGRGKAGGIQVVKDAVAAEKMAEKLLSMEIRGFPVKRVLVEQAVDIDKEYYLSVTLDRAQQCNVIIASSAGGMDIEEVAEKYPDKIAKVWIDPGLELKDFHIRQAVVGAGMDLAVFKQLSGILKTIYQLLRTEDATLVEINPLTVTGDGKVLALDGKMVIDDNALFRHPEFESLQEESGDEHPLEREAKEKGLAYVKLDGHVGIIGNGAGLVMTTLDMTQRNGGKAANFLDIGGGAKAEVVKNALNIVLSDPDVRSVLINVFGGITRCDEVAKGLLAVLNEVELKVPVVVRLAGTREEEGRELLSKTDKLTTAATFQEAAQKAVQLAK